VTAHESTISRVPDGVDMEIAAAVPEAYITAHDAMVMQGGLQPKGAVLIHAVGSGVGLAAMQIARAMGATTFGTARTESKLARAVELGLAHAVPADDFARRIESLTKGRGVDVVVDFVGAPYLEGNLAALAKGGRLILVGTMGGPTAQLDLSIVMRKRLTIRGTVLRSRTLEEKAEATRAFERDVLPLLARGAVRPVIDAVLPMLQVREAHARMGGNENFGKIVLRW
jgi:NADPH:quinone reductase-like Zn-dependent oxidoreductase